jgi:hypothetical protein
MIEQIVPRSDLGENPAHVPALLRPACRRRIGELRLRSQCGHEGKLTPRMSRGKRMGRAKPARVRGRWHGRVVSG